MTQTEFKKLKKGDRVKVVVMSGGHNYEVGRTYTVRSISGIYLAAQDRHGWVGNNLTAECVEFAYKTRAEEADYLESEAKRLNKEAKEMLAKVVLLRKYKDDNDELAHTIADAMKSNGSPETIYAILQKCSLLKKN